MLTCLLSSSPRNVRRCLANVLGVWTLWVWASDWAALAQAQRKWPFNSSPTMEVGRESHFPPLMCASDIHKRHDHYESTSKSSSHHLSHEVFWRWRTMLIPVYQMYQITPFILSQHNLSDHGWSLLSCISSHSSQNKKNGGGEVEQVTNEVFEGLWIQDLYFLKTVSSWWQWDCSLSALPQISPFGIT